MLQLQYRHLGQGGLSVAYRRVRGMLSGVNAVLSLVVGAFAAPAVGQACPDLEAQTVEALSRYDEGEVDAAKSAVAVGYASLTCQTRIVPTTVLLDLYRVDALVALTLDDPKAMVYATIRAVAAQHEGGRPPSDFGPDLQTQYDTWSARLKQDLVTVSVIDSGTAYVDGREVNASRPLLVVEGEHLIQVPNASGVVSSRIAELSGDYPITTGIGVPVAPLPVPVLVPDPLPMPLPLPVPAPTSPTLRRRPAAIVVGTLVSAGVAGFALGSGYRSDHLFQTSPYLADEFNGCARGKSCYVQARFRAIQADVTRINIAYGVGYGLSALSSGLLVVSVVGLPHKSD